MSVVRRLLVSAIVLGLVGTLTGVGTYAAFFSTASTDGDVYRAGTVYVSDDDAGSLVLDVSGIRPTDPAVSGCIVVSYGGSLPASAVLYGTSSGALAAFLDVTVTEGTGGTFGSCAGFVPSATLYSGTLAAFPTTWAGGLADADGTWTTGESHAYRFEISLQDDPAAQGQSGSASFTWEARNQ
ncbi:MAG: hypothetical protein ACE14W_02580 [Candidatus Velamenicoccus archaeovorus]